MEDAMLPRRRLLQAGMLATVTLAMLAAPAAARLMTPILYRCPPCARVVNERVRADISPAGAWVMGTTGGDPNTPQDDDQQLLYGFKPGGSSDIGSSYTTVRIVGPSGTVDDVPATAATQITEPNRVRTAWLYRAQYKVRVTETLSIDANPYSGHDDVVGFRYDLRNEDTTPLAVGIRALLDVRIGNCDRCDGAPYIVPGVGAVTHEQEWLGDAVPPFWLAFESPVFDPNRLRGVGILRRPGLTPPDRFVIASWPLIQFPKWDYPVAPTQAVTKDSAVALYWNPVQLAPGAMRTIVSQYGLAGDRGGTAFLTTPLEADCGSTFVAAFFVNNFEPNPLSGGLATVVLPPGLALARGETATKPVAPVAPGGTGSVTWQLTVAAGTSGPLAVSVNATFDNGRHYDASASVNATCVPPTATPTAPPTPTLAATPTATVTRTPRPTGTPDPNLARVCPYILGKVPEPAIHAALANPQHIRGWMEPLNPALPVGPNNPRKTWLSLQNLGAPYHPLFNTLVFKVGCP
jgi:hypothetical protein